MRLYFTCARGVRSANPWSRARRGRSRSKQGYNACVQSCVCGSVCGGNGEIAAR